MKQKETKLKPCPLCHSKNVVDLGYGVKCRNCELWLGSSSTHGEKGGYIKVWNRRSKKVEGL